MCTPWSTCLRRIQGVTSQNLPFLVFKGWCRAHLVVAARPRCARATKAPSQQHTLHTHTRTRARTHTHCSRGRAAQHGVAAHLWCVLAIDRMPLLRYRSGPRSCSNLDSHTLSFSMLQFPGICGVHARVCMCVCCVCVCVHVCVCVVCVCEVCVCLCVCEVCVCVCVRVWCVCACARASTHACRESKSLLLLSAVRVLQVS